MNTRIAPAVLLALLAAVPACEKKQPATVPTTTTTTTTNGSAAGDAMRNMGEAAKDAGAATKDAVKEAAKDVGDGFKALRDKAAFEIDSRITGSEPDFSRAKQRIDSLQGDDRTSAQRTYDDARSNMDKAKAMLGDLKDATAETWDKISAEARELANRAADAIKSLADGK